MVTGLTLAAEQLYRRTDPEALGFRTTDELDPLDAALGQESGIGALAFGTTMRQPGYNVFVLGESGSGRRTFVREALAARAAAEPVPPDWCYVQNFQDPRRPRAVSLGAGRAAEFRHDIGVLIADLRRAIPQMLDSQEATARRAALSDRHEREAETLLEELRAELAGDPYVALRESDQDLVLSPARGGEPLTHDAFAQLPDALRATIEEHTKAARARLLLVRRGLQEVQRSLRGTLAELNGEIGGATVEALLDPLRQRYRDEPAVLRHLAALRADVVSHAEQFAAAEPAPVMPPGVPLEDFFRRYAVNVFVQHAPERGAPVVEEMNPTYSALVGYVARALQFGAMVTDFTGITAGSLQYANGGYLVLDAEDVLSRPLAWRALKRALRTRELRPAEPSGEMGLYVTDTLEPEPIPAALKVVLVGEPDTFYMLRAADTEFRELFKVKADFRPDMERTLEAERAYARFVAAGAPRDGARAFDAAAVARVIEESSRIAADQNKLTTRFGLIADLVREATHWAGASDHAVVTAADVDRALAERDHRERRPHRSLLELIERGILAFDPDGDQVGQLYGLAVLTIGDEAFGRPMRIMATAYPGLAGLSNIEREVAMSGPIHSKAFLLLSGYVARRFARTRPLALSATLSFDQLYEEVEGDSASAAELFALLSAIAGIPVHQGIAVTGAVNPAGDILPVGGVTEKIEGYFAACLARGLTGRQGVIVPHRNLASLCLRASVREAVQAGRFHVWAIDRIEQGWPLLAGLEAGEERPDGTYPEATLYRAVTDQLDQWARQVGEGAGFAPDPPRQQPEPPEEQPITIELRP